MINPNQRFRIAAVVLLTIWLSAFPVTVSMSAQRERQVTATQTPAVPQPSPSPTATPAATPKASPAPVVVQPRTSNPTKTLTELQKRISEILAKPELSSAMVGIKVTSLDTGRVLFEENSAKLLRPASNMKLYTVSTALDRLSPDYRFTTSVYASSHPDNSGVVKGYLT